MTIHIPFTERQIITYNIVSYLSLAYTSRQHQSLIMLSGCEGFTKAGHRRRRSTAHTTGDRGGLWTVRLYWSGFSSWSSTCLCHTHRRRLVYDIMIISRILLVIGYSTYTTAILGVNLVVKNLREKYC